MLVQNFIIKDILKKEKRCSLNFCTDYRYVLIECGLKTLLLLCTDPEAVIIRFDRMGNFGTGVILHMVTVKYDSN